MNGAVDTTDGRALQGGAGIDLNAAECALLMRAGALSDEQLQAFGATVEQYPERFACENEPKLSCGFDMRRPRERKGCEMNVLWIMCDQLRYDYLGCTGHPHIQTSNIDSLAADGVSFTHAYAQSTICGPSRMSAYTGRYVRSHGSTSNAAPLRVGEPTLGDHLRDVGVDAVLIGKTHMTPDVQGMRRLGIETDGIIGVRTAECGFTPFLRDDGLHPDPADRNTPYFRHLRDHGLDADNPWESYANAAEGDDGELLSGWFMENARKPARVPAHLSESAFLTDQALSFMMQAKSPWVAHLSYIKPHWPYLAPAPYHDMYGPRHVVPVNRSEEELADPHPVLSEFRRERYAKVFSRDEVRETVIPTYMGLISEVDTQIGRLVRHLKENGQYQNTMIVFCSDHGDYLGDHWLGEKQMFHDPSVRIPFVIRDPRRVSDKTRGSICDQIVEMIDIAPTILGLYNAPPNDHVLEGRNLLPLLRDQADHEERQFAFSEYHYAEDRAGWRLGHPIKTAFARMVTSKRWKFVHFEHAEPLLYDRRNDPAELRNVAAAPENEAVVEELLAALNKWSRTPQANICTPFSQVEQYQHRQRHYDECAMIGYPIGYWSESELVDERRKQAAFLENMREP